MQRAEADKLFARRGRGVGKLGCPYLREHQVRRHRAGYTTVCVRRYRGAGIPNVVYSEYYSRAAKETSTERNYKNHETHVQED